jgi:hypothetical protein
VKGLVLVYGAGALVCSFALGGGLTVLAFFGVWMAVWIAFGSFVRWGERRRGVLLRDRGYY